MKAEPAAQRRLLDLQGVDTRIAQLQHRRRSLPEHAELAALQREHDTASQDLVAARTAVSDLEGEQAKAESDLQPVRDRLARNRQRIADGTVADPKALNGLVEEVEHLTRRIGDLEDAELDVMQRLEDATAVQGDLAGRVDALTGKVDEVTTRRDTALAQLDVELADAARDRTDVLPAVPADLLALYDKVRAGHGGTGAAELKGGRCPACRLELNASDLRAYATAAEDEVLRCEECNRILIRT